MGMVINTVARFGVSPFERAVAQLDPIVHARFRDSNFDTQIADSSGNNRHLLKQIAAATRSSVATRTTHPGGALFPSVTYDNWGTQGTFYKRAAESLLSGATEYTALISFRMVKAPSAHISKAFGVGTENVGESGDNDLAFMRASNNAPSSQHWWKHRTSNNGLIPVNYAVTEKLEDGVNRLAIARFKHNSIFKLSTSKPGHENLQEDTGTNNTGTGLKALSRALILNARTETNTGSNTTLEMVVDQIALFDTDIGATAEADLHSKWMDEVAGAGYYPSMMQFDGSTGYYNATYTSSGNKVTAVCRFNRASFTGDKTEVLMNVQGPTGDARIRVWAFSSDYSTLPNRADCLQVHTQNSAGTNVCLLLSPTGYLDGEDHVLFYAFDGDNGTAVLRIDGVDADDTGNADRIAPTAATLDSGASSAAVFGARAAGTIFFSGSLGMVGYRDAYLTNYADFMDGNLPKPIDEKDWTEFGSSQPLVFAHDGDLENNKGSAGDFTKNGSVTRTVGGSP